MQYESALVKFAFVITPKFMLILSWELVTKQCFEVS